MVGKTSVAGAKSDAADQPNIRTIGVDDLTTALRKGFQDFKALPTHLIFLAVIYPVLALLFVRAAAQDAVLPLVFPILAGYTLIGPLVAIGIYELSRRREAGLTPTRRDALTVLKSDSIGSILALGIALMVVYFAWLFVAQGLYQQLLGGQGAASVGGFLGLIFGTGAGWQLIILGSGIGFVFAAVVFTLSVVSFPMLVDRNVGIATALSTSVRAVMANKGTMMIWGFIVAAALLIGSIPVFVGLAVVLPILGHATWHLYKAVVDP